MPNSIDSVEAYLDHAATTPISSLALEALTEAMTVIGNPSGSHRAARRAKDLLETSREQIAILLGVSASEVIFTSGGTEADNLAILGSLVDGKKVVSSSIEHHAVLDTVRSCEGKLIGATSSGVIDLWELEAFLAENAEQVGLVSVMMVNNETGVIQPLQEVRALVSRYCPWASLHTDAVQAPNFLDVSDAAQGFNLISLSGHKFGGPKGVGVLVTRDVQTLRPIFHGGGQERELRSGTPNLAGVAAMATALNQAVSAREENVARIARLTEKLRSRLSAKLAGIKPNGIEERQMCNITNYCFEGLSSEEILFLLDSAGVYASAGSSCASGALNPSHVLLAMGKSKSEAGGSLRLSLGTTTSEEEVDYAAEVIGDVVLDLAKKKGVAWA